MDNSHEINVISETKDYHRDRVTLIIACSTPNCVYGKVAGSPAASMRHVVELLHDEHKRKMAAVPVGEGDE